MRQMTSLKSALKEGSSVPELAFHDGHLDAIFAFVGIALAGVAALAAFVLLFFSCCCGVAEEVGKVKLGAFSWTVATGLCSIWILGGICTNIRHKRLLCLRLLCFRNT